MPTRRRTILAAAGLASAGLTGCTEFVFGEGLTFEASEPSVSESALQDTGYEEHEVRPLEINRTVEVGDQSRDITAKNWQAEYDKPIDFSGLDLGELGGRRRAATFTVVSTPKVEVLDRTLNPIDDMSPAEIVQKAQQRYDGFGNLRKVDETTTSLVGETVAVSEFEGTAELTEAGVEIDLTLHVSEAASSGDDFVIAVAGYPSALSATERDNAIELINGVEHGG